MSDLILHHYPTSPYGEIVRLALGLKGLAWRSCEQPVILPRPALMALTGGYRRIPVMQIGADIYCDTQMILRELERRFPEPALAGVDRGLAWGLRAWAERAWFGVTVGVIFGARGPHVPEAFIKDREQLSGRPFDVAAMTAAAPMLRDQWRAHAGLVDDQLADGRAFLLGDRAGLADLAAYLNVWFMKSGLPEGFAALTADMPMLRAWADRVAAVGHGQPTPISAEAALAVARAGEPEPARASTSHEAQGLAPGQRVMVMADDYGRDPIAGEIVLIARQEIAIARETAEAGRVVVHFPRAGFLVRAA
jgi:glutathione S-transferase